MTIHGMNIVMVIHQPRLNNYLVCDQVGLLPVERANVRCRKLQPHCSHIGCNVKRTAATIMVAYWFPPSP